MTASGRSRPYKVRCRTQDCGACPAPREGGVQVGEYSARSAEPFRSEQYAYTLGVQAYIFGFPYVYLPSLRWDWVARPKPPNELSLSAPINHFSHVRRLADASYRSGGSPNQDTLYSMAWVDVGDEPVILSHPDMGDRYFTFQLASMDSDNFAYVGKRTTGGKAGSFAIVGPGWKGRLPAGVKALPASRTPSVLIFGRTLIDGPADAKTVNALQDQYTLVPLSFWGRKDATLPSSRDVWKPFDPKTDPLAEWRTMNRAMTENPPEARLAKLVELFSSVGVGPGQDLDTLDEATKRGLARAAVDGRKLLASAINSGQLGKRLNNWSIPPSTFGRAGLVDDFLLRGSLQCMGGIISNDAEEAVYYNTTMDGAGQTFDGARNYSIRFAPANCRTSTAGLDDLHSEHLTRRGQGVQLVAHTPGRRIHAGHSRTTPLIRNDCVGSFPRAGSAVGSRNLVRVGRRATAERQASCGQAQLPGRRLITRRSAPASPATDPPHRTASPARRAVR